MGTKPVFKRYKNPVYVTICIAISFFLSGCQHTAFYQIIPASVDTDEKNYLTKTRGLILENDFKSAAKENQRMLKYYSGFPDSNDIISSNYVQHAQIISHLLIRIMDDEKKTKALNQKIRINKTQIEALTQNVKSLKKKMADMDAMVKKIKALEHQIERLKEIDLNPDKIIGNPEKYGENQTDGKLISIINKNYYRREF